MQVLEHYVRCSRTNNHTVREAACTCIAELAAKIDPEAVRPHVPAMLRTVITCMRDDSWPVRSCSVHSGSLQHATLITEKTHATQIPSAKHDQQHSDHQFNPWHASPCKSGKLWTAGPTVVVMMCPDVA